MSRRSFLSQALALFTASKKLSANNNNYNQIIELMQLSETIKLFNDALKWMHIKSMKIKSDTDNGFHLKTNLKRHTGLTPIGIMNRINITKQPANEEVGT